VPHQYAADNPLRFIDKNGDSLDVGQNAELSLTYLQSLHPELAKRLSLNANNRVVFDTQKLDLGVDASLELMNRLVNGEGMYLFEVCDQTSGVLRADSPLGQKGDVVPIDLTDAGTTGIANLSITPFLENGPGGLLPQSGYQGQVSIGRGSWSELSTPSVVFHELSENRYRTESPGMPYARYQNDLGHNLGGSHERAILDANRFMRQQGDLWKGNRYTPR
jgi:hypothetical protein